MKTISSMLAACGLVTALAACGDDEKKPANTTDATSTTDGTTTTDGTSATTTATATDATSNDGETTTPTCDETGITIVSQSLEYSEEEDTTFYEGVTAGEATVDALLIQFYPALDGSSPSPLTGPGTYPIGASEVDQNFATCETCVLVLDDCDAEGCARVFFATSGSVVVTELDQAGFVMKGTLTNAVLVEVTIDDASESTPVPNGDTWCLPSVAFDSTPECVVDEDCTEPGKTVCDTDTLTCVGCISLFDCSGATPVCEATELTCVAQIDECTGDDAAEPNDGPSASTALTLGEAKAAAACTGETEQEFDWYTFTTTGEKNLTARMTWENADAAFFVVFFNEAGQALGSPSETGDTVHEQFAALAPAGKYYAVVRPVDTTAVGNGGTAVAYSLTVTAEDPECSATKACTDGARPICDLTKGACVVCADDFDCTAATPACLADDTGVTSCGKLDLCTGDDATETDDGPTGATTITLGAAATAAKICGDNEAATAEESDWYKFELAAVTDVTVTLTWEGAPDLDFAVFKADGELVDEALVDQPEILDLPALAVGTYYVQVLSYEGAETAAIGYTLAVATTAP